MFQGPPPVISSRVKANVEAFCSEFTEFVKREIGEDHKRPTKTSKGVIEALDHFGVLINISNDFQMSANVILTVLEDRSSSKEKRRKKSGTAMVVGGREHGALRLFFRDARADLDAVPGMRVSLCRAPSDESFDRQLAAIESLSRVTPTLHPTIKELLVMPREDPQEASILAGPCEPLEGALEEMENWRDCLLNQEQSKLIALALRQRVTLIQGPPGTGKTHTAGHLAALVARSRQGLVLCVCETNTAADHLAAKVDRLGTLVVRAGPHAGVQFQREHAHLCLPSPGSRQSAQQLASASVIVCTNNAASQLVGKIRKVQLLIIDESDKATVASAVIPLCLAQERVCLFGDHRQLSPYINQHDAEDPRCRSVFEHLRSRGVPTHMNTLQYRMCSDIARWPSERYYSGRLSTAQGVDAQRPLPRGIQWVNEFPVLFVETPGGAEATRGNSFYNLGESEAATTLVNSLSPSQDVAILSGYSAQIKVLREGLDKAHRSVKVSTVDAFQGLEADLVIISTTRTRKLGFMGNPKRINVMLTRARAGIVIFGRRDTLCDSDDWSSWFQFYDASTAPR